MKEKIEQKPDPLHNPTRKFKKSHKLGPKKKKLAKRVIFDHPHFQDHSIPTVNSGSKRVVCFLTSAEVPLCNMYAMGTNTG